MRGTVHHTVPAHVLDTLVGWLPEAEHAVSLREVATAVVEVVNGRPTTPVSARIGPVYTPPGQRGRGYAGALTAHVTGELLAAGHERVTLFTDQTNATSNALYARVGYVDVGAHGSWLVTTGRQQSEVW